MPKINLNESNGYTVVPEGVHTFQITEVNYKETYGKLTITMKTVDGLVHIERFSLLTNSGEINNGALNAFGYFARVALNDFSVKDVDPTDLIGHYMTCEVSHDVVPNKNKPGQTVTFSRLGNKESATGFDTNKPLESTPMTDDPLYKFLGN